jgi:hypothetical protein
MAKEIDSNLPPIAEKGENRTRTIKPLELEQCVYTVNQIASLLYTIEFMIEEERPAASMLSDVISLARQLTSETGAILHDVVFSGEERQQRSETYVPGHWCY